MRLKKEAKKARALATSCRRHGVESLSVSRERICLCGQIKPIKSLP
ncbi:hypothetical protein HMPREF1619_01854 [Klebsiella pneumoniae 909957]|nr:hypothetical protein HMPREF9538_05189 [Klebsiella sp. MS 92-3]ESB01935.1 hypothetical protein HMPREF1619_01854 [Klebsiella pneumoniae 909957]KXA20742.1 hypothetical protein HMPREF3197_05029 [Klebsiella pneumoniae]